MITPTKDKKGSVIQAFKRDTRTHSHEHTYTRAHAHFGDMQCIRIFCMVKRLFYSLHHSILI